ncbi:hypothetical protein [Achromobacter aegrifaciens]
MKEILGDFLQMGYQLWTSPITGYRRRGTRLKDYHDELGEKISVTAIYEPLQSCSRFAASVEIRAELVKRDFDIVGVRENEFGLLLGFARQSCLESGVVGDHTENIPVEALVGAENSVRSLLDVFLTKSYAFVEQDGNVDHIVARADLNKPIVRAFFFGLISLLEIHLSFWVNELYPDESWVNVLKKERLRKAIEHRERIQQAGLNPSLLECLQFCDKRDLVVNDATFFSKLGFGSKKEAKRILEKAEALRNHLAHSQYDLTSGSSWEEQIEILQKIDSTVSLSDELVEKSCAERAESFMSMLWCARGARKY